MEQNLSTSTVRIDSPVFVTGTPKAGKSVLLEVFHQFEHFYVVDEPLSTWRIGINGKADDCRTAEDATDEEVKRVRNEIARTLKDSGKNRYVDLLSHHALQLPYLRKIYPDSKVLVVTRDPRSFIPEAVYFWTLKPSVSRTLRNRWRNVKLASLPAQARRFVANILTSRKSGRLNTWGAIVPGQTDSAASYTVPELAAYQWAIHNNIAIQAAQDWGNGVMFIKFEELKSQPTQTMEAIFRFCQIRPDAKVLDFAESYIDATFQTEQRIALPESDWEQVRPLVVEVAEKLGYDLS